MKLGIGHKNETKTQNLTQKVTQNATILLKLDLMPR
jgi:hypothetical protein